MAGEAAGEVGYRNAFPLGLANPKVSLRWRPFRSSQRHEKNKKLDSVYSVTHQAHQINQFIQP